ncbi:hypothetical protein IW262DRAFT_669213 [Armillaria fumosa]|nr:hypothetical protein IW262DRAFT_669213 [Armillaria fumosa]
MRAYLQKLLELYPGSGISPYQHLSLHFGELLRSFGPNHAWRCWAFERYNGIIQKINTNNIFGEMSLLFLAHRIYSITSGDMEITMLKTFCRQQNLRALYHPGILPMELQPMIEIYRRAYLSDHRGTMTQQVSLPIETGDIPYQHSQKGVKLSSSITEQLLKFGESAPSSVRLIDKVTYRGRTFTTQKTAVVNSNVCYGPTVAGRIHMMFMHQSRTYVVIHSLRELTTTHRERDNFITYRQATGRLVYNEYNKTSCHIVAPLEDIVHCAITELRVDGIGNICNHVLPLDFEDVTPSLSQSFHSTVLTCF